MAHQPLLPLIMSKVAGTSRIMPRRVQNVSRNVFLRAEGLVRKEAKTPASTDLGLEVVINM